MEITDKNLERFRDWMVARGRVEGTADLYVLNVKSCAASPGGVTQRLISSKLSPNTMRSNLAALRAWAKFSKDEDLRDILGDIRLPPARRIRSKEPLDDDTWSGMVRSVMNDSRDTRNIALQQVVLIMAVRGLRSGDVLRMRRTDIVRALATGKLVYEAKGRKRIEIAAAPIRAQLEELAEFKVWDKVADLVSTSKNPAVIRGRVYRAVRRIGKAMKVDAMSPHRFRHTFASAYLRELHGDPNAIVKLQKYMAWESLSTAARYVDRVSQDQLDDVGAGVVSKLMRQGG